MCNQEIRAAVKRSGIRMWQLAEALGIADTTLCKRLRKELSDNERKSILEVISKLERG